MYVKLKDLDFLLRLRFCNRIAIKQKSLEN